MKLHNKYGTRTSDWYGLFTLISGLVIIFVAVILYQCIGPNEVPAAQGPVMCQTATVKNGMLKYHNGYQERTIDIKHIHTMNGVEALDDESGGVWTFYVGNKSQRLQDVNMKACVDVFFKVVLQKIGSDEDINFLEKK